MTAGGPYGFQKSSSHLKILSTGKVRGGMEEGWEGGRERGREGGREEGRKEEKEKSTDLLSRGILVILSFNMEYITAYKKL